MILSHSARVCIQIGVLVSLANTISDLMHALPSEKFYFFQNSAEEDSEASRLGYTLF